VTPVFAASFSLYLPGFYHFPTDIKAKKQKPESALSSEAADELRAFEVCKKEVSKGFPSVSQIAHIAAILANRNSTDSAHPLTIADRLNFRQDLRRHAASWQQAETGHQRRQEEQIFNARFRCLIPIMN
jgi:hypothetical protein